LEKERGEEMKAGEGEGAKEVLEEAKEVLEEAKEGEGGGWCQGSTSAMNLSPTYTRKSISV